MDQSLLDICLSLPSYQVRKELNDFVDAIAKYSPKVILEIGSFGGASSLAFSSVAPDDAIIICVDINTSVYRQDIVRHYMKPNQSLILIEGDSTRQDTIDKVKEALGGNLVDLLFIDGGHDYPTVYGDYVHYSQFVKNAGIIGLHDVAVRIRDGRDCFYGTDILFNKLNKLYKTKTISYPDFYKPENTFESAGIGWLEYYEKDFNAIANSLNFICIGNYQLSYPDYIAVLTTSIVNRVDYTPYKCVIWTDGNIVQNEWYDNIKIYADFINIKPSILKSCESLNIYHKIDCIRYQLMEEFGGLWADLDIVSIKPFANQTFKDRLYAGIEQEPARLCTAIMYSSSPKNESITSLKKNCFEIMPKLGEMPYRNGQLGPVLITEHAATNPSDLVIFPINCFYKYDWLHTEKIYGDGEIADDMYMLHLWSYAKNHKEIIRDSSYLSSDSLYSKSVRKALNFGEYMTGLIRW